MTTPQQDPNAGIRQAGTVAIWVWIVLSLIPVLGVLGCFAMCLLGAISGGGDTTR